MEKATKFAESIRWPSRIDKDNVALPVISIAAAATLLYSTYRLVSSNNRQRNGKYTKEIPSPGSCYPYVGHMFSLGQVPSIPVNKWHNELGPLIKLQMGRKTWIMVNDPFLAHKIFVNNGAATSYRPHTVYGYHYYGMDGKGVVFAQPGAGFKKNRAAALSLLAPKQIASFAPNIKEESTNLVTRLIEATEKYGSVDPLKNLELNAMNVILEATFGKRFKSVDDPEFRKLSEIVELSMKYAGLENDLSNFLPIISFVDNYTGRQYKWRKFMTTERNPAYEELIKQAMLKDSPNLMNALEENGYPMTMDEKIVFASDMVAAGTDTISVTLSWNFVLMCHHPEVQKRVSAEIDAFVAKHGHLPTFEERSEVPLCISVIKESMRFRPATFFGLPHTLHEEIEVDGYVIPKDATILASMHSMHLNPNCYTNPEKFIPDRFMDNLRTMQSCANGRIEERDHYNFGWGRRVCPGISLAEAEVFASFIQVYSRCFIEPADGKTMPDIETLKNVGLTVLPAAQKLKFTKRF